MEDGLPEDDARYLAGIVLFNRGDFFEAHEVWEAVWLDTCGPDKPFFQGLIQAAVGLCHFCNGNVRGAAKLYHSCRGYLQRFGPTHRGLDLADFLQQMQTCFAPLLASDPPPAGLEITEEWIPTMTLDPEPETWPDPDRYLPED